MLAYGGRPCPAIFPGSFPLQGACHAPETIPEICPVRVALATAIISQTASRAETLMLMTARTTSAPLSSTTLTGTPTF